MPAAPPIAGAAPAVDGAPAADEPATSGEGAGMFAEQPASAANTKNPPRASGGGVNRFTLLRLVCFT